MNYFFYLGNNAELSIAEIIAYYQLNKQSDCLFLEPSRSILLLESKQTIDPATDIKKMGGIIKIGQIIKELNNYSNLKKEILKLLPSLLPIDREKKIKFGFSVYGNQKIDLKSLAMEIKKELKNSGLSSRWVNSRDKILSSVVVGQNKLLENGFELNIIINKNKIFIGQSQSYQDYKGLSFRDFGRPMRDDYSGMLPPKLAQIMLNLGQITPEKVLLDPFCGSGTIVSEAFLMGVKKIIGSDISNKAVVDSQQNLIWLQKNCKLKNNLPEIYQLDATKLSTLLPKKSVDLIVCEPYLGPARGKIDYKKIINDLNNLYAKTIAEFAKILKTQGRIVMVWPVLKINNNSFTINPNLGKFSLLNPLTNWELPNLKLSPRQTLIYGRSGQKVFREIVILE